MGMEYRICCTYAFIHKISAEWKNMICHEFDNVTFRIGFNYLLAQCGGDIAIFVFPIHKWNI